MAKINLDVKKKVNEKINSLVDFKKKLTSIYGEEIASKKVSAKVERKIDLLITANYLTAEEKLFNDELLKAYRELLINLKQPSFTFEATKRHPYSSSKDETERY